MAFSLKALIYGARVAFLLIVEKLNFLYAGRINA